MRITLSVKDKLINCDTYSIPVITKAIEVTNEDGICIMEFYNPDGGHHWACDFTIKQLNFIEIMINHILKGLERLNDG